jgi:hypothetical protein
MHTEATWRSGTTPATEPAKCNIFNTAISGAAIAPTVVGQRLREAREEIEGGRLMPEPVTLFLCRLTRFSKMGKALHQLRIADGVATLKFYCCRMSYMRVARDPVRRRSSETTQALVERLRAAEAHKDALCGLWNGLLNAAPSAGRQVEMRLTMARYEIMICDLHEIKMRALDL